MHGRVPVLYLLNATDKYYGYPNPWLSGKGRHQLAYALFCHHGDWRQARISRMAWEYNSPPILVPEVAPVVHKSFLQTSENIIVEAMRRVDVDVEVRMVECLGYAGTAEIRLHLPHERAYVTDLLGRNLTELKGGPAYRFEVRPQQIVTLRFRVASAVDEPVLVQQWDALVPSAKRKALHAYSTAKGHPPHSN